MSTEKVVVCMVALVACVALLGECTLATATPAPQEVGAPYNLPATTEPFPSAMDLGVCPHCLSRDHRILMVDDTSDDDVTKYLCLCLSCGNVHLNCPAKPKVWKNQ